MCGFTAGSSPDKIQPLSLSGDSATAARRPEGAGFDRFGDRIGKCERRAGGHTAAPGSAGATSSTQHAVGNAAGRLAPSPTRRGRPRFTTNPAAQVASKGGQDVSLTGVRLLAPECTAHLAASVVPAFLRDAQQAHRNLQAGGEEMAPTAAPAGWGQCAYACAESELRAKGAGGRGGARSVPSPGR